ncbi:MAG TPA: MerR family transcriptional regulator [Polyangia bacterium]|nr:MerR family transcriptional regulator [Polyangia bacterium]
MKRRTYQVKEVAALAGVSVRALHHWDEIGLLVPRARTEAGYRLYDDEDLLRLQQILVGRELGLPLEEIRRSLDDPRFDRRAALRAQRRELETRAAHTAAMIRAVDHALAALDAEGGGTMDAEKLFEGFDHGRHEAEAERRWGGTPAFEESRRRTRRYTPDDWRRHAAEQAAVYADAAALMKAGAAPGGPPAMDVAERHRLLVDRWFYPCPPAMHAGLADLYEADPRFAASIDAAGGAGLTPFLAAAIRANARR